MHTHLIFLFFFTNNMHFERPKFQNILEVHTTLFPTNTGLCLACSAYIPAKWRESQKNGKCVQKYRSWPYKHPPAQRIMQ